MSPMSDENQDERVRQLVVQHLTASGQDDVDEVDEETLAAYCEGKLSDRERERCESVLARGGQLYQEFLVLTEFDLGTSAGEESKPVRLADSTSGSKRHRNYWTVVAASIAFALVGGGLVKTASERNRLSSQISQLESNALAQRFTIAEMSSNVAMQESGYQFWIGQNSGLSAEWDGASMRARPNASPTQPQLIAETNVVAVAKSSDLRAEDWLRLAGLQTKLRQTINARKSLSKASSLSSTTAYKNTQACLLIAESLKLAPADPEFSRLQNKAAQILQECVKESPTAEMQFNLANLYLTQSQMLDVSIERKQDLAQDALFEFDAFLGATLSERERQLGQSRRSEALALVESAR